MRDSKRWSFETAATRAVGVSPCMDCTERYPACAGHCDRYKDWKQRLDETKKKLRNAERGAQKTAAYWRMTRLPKIKYYDIPDDQ